MRNLLHILFAVIVGNSFISTSNGNADDENNRLETPARSELPQGTEVLGPALGHFILLQGGEFVMGSKSAEKQDAKHEHLVELSPFHIGRTPVTNEQFVLFLNGDHVSSKEYVSGRLRPERRSISEEHGVWSCVKDCSEDACGCETWMLADRYCRWLSRVSAKSCRLPTEAEWEFACRGKEGRKYPWGDKPDRIDQRTWRWRGWEMTKPRRIAVGSFPEGATPEGVCDLVGYMDECCSDWYSAEYYTQSAKVNPQGPAEPGSRDSKVRRGGLEHAYDGLFHRSKYFAVLPSGYLPTGWSRRAISQAASPARGPSEVYGRLGFRVVVEHD